MVCAQRLSASTDKSPAFLDARQQRDGLVLNAFRHQRINHQRVGETSCSIKSRAQRLSASTDKSPEVLAAYGVYASGAQRLSASTDKSLNSGNPSRDASCAQRLSASTDKSLVANPLSQFAATSAQRLSASTDKSLGLKRVPPVGRLGAQRLSASTDKSQPTLLKQPPCVLQCSTPFGING